MARLILFDVNETLLDLRAMDEHFERLFGSSGVRVEWFLTLEEAWLTGTVVNRYRPFGELAEAALEMTAARHGTVLDSAQRSEVLDALKRLPAHDDVRPALERLRGAGLRLAALTNGTLKSARAQLRHAELDDLFEAILSADEVQRMKPAPEPYALAAERLGVRLEEIRMVAAHAWDIAGAAAVGCATGFVERPGKVPYPHGPHPDLRGRDLAELAERILEADRPG